MPAGRTSLESFAEGLARASRPGAAGGLRRDPQATYADPGRGERLQAIRVLLRDRLRVATTVASRPALPPRDRSAPQGRPERTASSSKSPARTRTTSPSRGSGTASRRSRPPRPRATSRPCRGGRRVIAAPPRREGRAAGHARGARSRRGRRRGGSDAEGPDGKCVADESCVLVIFGASGDLTAGSSCPPCGRCSRAAYCPSPSRWSASARTQMRQRALPHPHARGHHRLRARPAAVAAGVGPLRPGPLLLHRRSRRRRDLPRPGRLRREVERERGTGGNRLFYLSTPPSLYPHLVATARRGGTDRAAGGRQGWVRIVIEKPFGRDLASSRALNQVVAGVFSEDQVYRIDHYLGKETVQNILVFRFANGIFEPLWNRNHVDHVQITVGETIGVEGARRVLRGVGRAARHDPEPHPPAPVPGRHGAAGHLRRRSRARREEQGDARDPADPARRGGLASRCAASTGRASSEASASPGYREEQGVSPESITETYAALELGVDNWRWAGVPFYLRTGKRLPKRASEIAVQFQPHAAPGLPAQPGDSRRAQPARPAHPARRGDLAVSSAPSCPGSEPRIKSGGDGLRLRQGVRRPSRPRPTSACCSTR